MIDQIVAAAKDLTGAGLNSDAITLALSTYMTFPTLDDVRSSILKEGNPLNFYANAEKLMADAKKIGTVPSDGDVHTFQVQQQVFDKLQANTDLVAWINKPL